MCIYKSEYVYRACVLKEGTIDEGLIKKGRLVSTITELDFRLFGEDHTVADMAISTLFYFETFLLDDLKCKNEKHWMGFSG